VDLLKDEGCEDDAVQGGDNKKGMDASMDQSEYMFEAELSALGLHLDKSANFRAGDIDAKDTRMSFIPSDLLLEAQEAVAEAKPSNLPLPKALPPMDVITPKLEYTKQYRGLRLETIPPPAFSHPKVQNEAGRRRSIHTRRTEMAVCA
jgi:hypothetical protein